MGKTWGNPRSKNKSSEKQTKISVANVNKSTMATQSSGMKRKIDQSHSNKRVADLPKRIRRIEKSGNSSDQSQVKEEVDLPSTSNHQRQPKETEACKKGRATTHIKVPKGDQMLSIDVDANDSLYQEQTESEDEGAQAVRGGVSDHDPDSEEGEGEPNLAPPNVDRQAVLGQLCQLDDELTEKIQDLHKRLSEQGLTGAAELLNDCFEPQIQNRGMFKVMRVCSVQQNHNVNHNVHQVTSNKSVETIYNKEVQECSSSSSEDNLELSDESMNLNNEPYHVSGTPGAENRA